MTAPYRPVQWNKFKWRYDAVIAAAIGIYILTFLKVAPLWGHPAQAVEYPILRMRAFGTCAFILLTIILCIGPLARIDTRFLPMLYNRRHLGVMTALVALTHASDVLAWYYAFSPTDPYVAVLAANTSFGRVLGFPFELFGVFALLVLLVLAATSHDFWLAFLTAPMWKAIHMSIYFAYLAVVVHVGLGYLQTPGSNVFASVVAASVIAVSTLHIVASRREAAVDLSGRSAIQHEDWIDVCRLSELRDGRGRVVPLPNGERVAIFRYDGKLSAVSNVCAHQNGPLGEGRIVDGLVTCPWHGFQYRPEDGCAPAPFTEKIATFQLRLDGDMVRLHSLSNAAGTRVEPVRIPDIVQ